MQAVLGGASRLSEISQAIHELQSLMSLEQAQVRRGANSKLTSHLVAVCESKSAPRELVALPVSEGISIRGIPELLDRGAEALTG